MEDDQNTSHGQDQSQASARRAAMILGVLILVILAFLLGYLWRHDPLLMGNTNGTIIKNSTAENLNITDTNTTPTDQANTNTVTDDTNDPLAALSSDERDCRTSVFRAQQANITDSSHQLVQASRSFIVNRVSEKYFQDHFVFVCALNDEASERNVNTNVGAYAGYGSIQNTRWLFHIGEYSALLDDTLTNGSHLAVVNGLSAVESVIARTEAEKQLTTCLQGQPEKKVVEFAAYGNNVTFDLRGERKISESLSYMAQINLASGDCRFQELRAVR